MRGPDWRSLLRLAEWLGYIVIGSGLIAITMWLLGVILNATGLSVPWQTLIAKVVVGALGLVVFLLVIAMDVVNQIRRLLGRTAGGDAGDGGEEENGDQG